MKKNSRKLTTPQSLNAYIKSICDIMRRSGRAGALQYVPELTWMLFLRILDEKEEKEQEHSKALGVKFTPSLEYPYRWQDWASPTGKKRKELQQGTLGGFMSFVDGKLIPHLRNLEHKTGATARQKVISEVFSSVEKTGIDTERNLLDILDKINELSIEQVDDTHMFTLSQVYEGLLLNMGAKNNDGGQFFTPREVIRIMVKVIDPNIGERVYDPCFLAGTEICTKKGWVPIEKIQVGDEVWTHCRRWRKVTRVFRRFTEEPLVAVRNALWPKPILATDNHPFLTYGITPRVFAQGKRKGTTWDYMWLPLAEYGKHDKNWDYHVFIPPLPFTQNMLNSDEQLAYLCGVFAGDGYTDKNGVYFCLSPKDALLSLEIANLMKKYFDVSIDALPQHSNNLAMRIRFCSRVAAHFFREHCGQRAENKQIPYWSQQSCRLSALRGLIKTDGSIQTHDTLTAILVDTCSQRLAENTLALAYQCGFLPSIRKTPGSQGYSQLRRPLYRVAIYGRDAENFLNHCGLKHTKNKRKFQKSKLGYVLDGAIYLKSTITKKNLGRVEVFNIEVEEDNSYTTRIATVHNCCGTGGFLAQSYQHMRENVKTADDIEVLKTRTFYGREKENLAYPIALANLVLHDIDEPHIWHGNTLTGLEVYGGLFQGAPDLFDVVLTNPPFGGKEGKDARTHFAYKTSATQILFLQHVIDSLKNGGRCGIVIDEGVLFRTNENAFVQTKRKLLNECNVFCLVSLPPKVFVNAGAASKTNLLFFTKGEPTKEIWYYDLSDFNVTKKQPFTLQHFDEFFKLLPKREDSQRSWKVSIDDIQAKNFDIKAVNPNRKVVEDTRTPQELISIIESQGAEITQTLTKLKNKF